MLSFIICEDNTELRKINEEIINKIMFNNNLDYKIFSYSNYTPDLKNKIKEKSGKKVYILDIELGDYSGIEIAREIRKNDWDSFILMTTVHTELFPQVFMDKLMLFDFISKYDNYSKNFENTIKKIIRIYSANLPFVFNIRKTIYQISYEEILYLIFDKEDRKTLICTTSKYYKVSKSLKSLSTNLPDYFIRINNHCVINKNNVKNINSKGTIEFINNIKINEIIKREIKDNVFC